MIPKPVIHPMAAQHLRELRERWGVEPTLEESLWIVKLCARVLNPVSGSRRDLIGIPARCGDSAEWLWPITIGAGVWFQDFASVWWRGDSERMFKALAFALSHARDKETLTALRDSAAAARMIRDWASKLTCTREELEAAVDEVLPPVSRQTKGERPQTDWTELVIDLAVITGIPNDHWVWDISRSETINAWVAARRVAAARGGSDCEGVSAADEAVKDLAEAKAAIVKAHREDGHGQNP